MAISSSPAPAFSAPGYIWADQKRVANASAEYDAGLEVGPHLLE